MNFDEFKVKAREVWSYESISEDGPSKGKTVIYHRSIWLWDVLHSLSVAFLFYILTDEGCKRVLETVGCDCTNSAWTKVLRWGTFAGIVAYTVFLIVWKWKNDGYAGECEKKDKKIGGLCDTISELQVVAKRFNTVHDNLHLIFLRHLEAIGNTLNFGRLDRISLYVLDGDKFVQIARHSQNPEYKKRGRLVYPIDKGIIAETRADNELVYHAALPDYGLNPVKYADIMLKEYGMDKNVVDRLTMHPRFMAGLRISSPDGNDWKAVLIVESDRANAWQKKMLADVLKRNKSCMYKLMCDFPDCVSSIPAALKEGL